MNDKKQNEIDYDKSARRGLLQRIRVAKNGTVSQRTVTQVLLAMEDHYSTQNLVWPSQETIVDVTKISEKSVRNAITWLRCRGLIDVEKRYRGRSKNTCNHYSFLFANMAAFVLQPLPKTDSLHCATCDGVQCLPQGKRKKDPPKDVPPASPEDVADSNGCLSNTELAPSQQVIPDDRPASTDRPTGKYGPTDRQVRTDRPASSCRLITTEPPKEQPIEPPPPAASGSFGSSIGGFGGLDPHRLAAAELEAKRYCLALADVATRWKRRLSQTDRDIIADLAADVAAGTLPRGRVSQAVSETDAAIVRGQTNGKPVKQPVSVLAAIVQRLTDQDQNR